MKKHWSNYFILLTLAILFATPGITAYLFYQHPGWLSAPKVNHGTLMNPPVALSILDASSKWRLVYWNPGVCAQTCLKQIDKLARIRLALGRKLYLVEQRLIIDNLQDTTEAVKKTLKQRDFHVTHLSSEDFTKDTKLNPSEQIFIVNPDNYLVLSYKLEAKSDDIYKDLKLLLNTNETKSGSIDAK